MDRIDPVCSVFPRAMVIGAHSPGSFSLSGRSKRDRDEPMTCSLTCELKTSLSDLA